MTLFSIVIPVYNVEQYLDECVTSVLSQSYTDFEILLIDDGSPDNSGKLCDEWAKKDRRIRVFHQENRGLSGARNTGIRHADGEYLLFLDSDDRWADDSVLSGISDTLDKTEADVLSFNYCKEYNGRPDAPYFSETIPSSEKVETLQNTMDKGVYVTGACNKAIRREMITDNDLYFREGITSEDIDWTLRLALCGKTFAFANITVFIYRQHAASISHSLSPEKTECLCTNVKECVHLLQDAPIDKSDALKSFTAYQYGTLLHNAALLKKSQTKDAVMNDISEMQWLLACSDNPKIKALYRICRIFGLKCVLFMLRQRKFLLDIMGKGV